MHWMTHAVAGLMITVLLPAVSAAQTVSGQPGASAPLRDAALLRVQSASASDPVGNGIAIGAIAGAAVGAGVSAVHSVKCDASCDILPRKPMYITATAMGAGIGALSGWLIDSVRNSRSPTPAHVAPILSKERKGVAFSFSF